MTQKELFKYLGFKNKPFKPGTLVQIGDVLTASGERWEYLVLEDGSLKFIQKYKALTRDQHLDALISGLKNVFKLYGNKRK